MTILPFTFQYPELARAVIDQMGGMESFHDHAADVANYGAAGGFTGFIYYTETGRFYRTNRASINRMVVDMAQEFGMEPIQFVRSFNCMQGQGFGDLDVAAAMLGQEDADVLIENALSWFALEEVCRAYADQVEEV